MPNKVDVDREWIRWLYQTELMIDEEIATLYGVRKNLITSRRKTWGIPTMPIQERNYRKAKRTVPPSLLRWLYESQGWTVNEIARHYGLGKGVLRSYMKQEGIPFRKVGDQAHRLKSRSVAKPYKVRHCKRCGIQSEKCLCPECLAELTIIIARKIGAVETRIGDIYIQFHEILDPGPLDSENAQVHRRLCDRKLIFQNALTQ